jgi:hypothetical protein
VSYFDIYSPDVVIAKRFLSAKDPDFTWLEERLFSKLNPSSFSTLRKLKIFLWDNTRTADFPPFGGLIAELAPVIGSLTALEDIGLTMEFPLLPEFTLGSEWMALENLLERSHRKAKLSSRFRKLHVEVGVRVLYPNYGDWNEGRHEARRKWEFLFEAGYVWCRDNLDFTTVITISDGCNARG